MFLYTQSCRCLVRSCALLITLPVASTFAEVITVDDDGKADFASIQAAIDYASDGDEIVVAPGVYTSDHPAHVVDLLGKTVVLRSSDGPEVTVIDGEKTRRGITCLNGETSDTIIEGFSIQNGLASFGGGMYNSSSSPTLTNCTFEYNSATGTHGLGGGMCNYQSSPTLTNCTFTNNLANARGGGMYNEDSNPTLIDCTFTGNSAAIADSSSEHGGGGMYNWSSSPTLTGCTFASNSAKGASGNGGGMFNFDESSPTLINCSISDNSAMGTYGGGGGMINVFDSSPVLTGCTVNGNSCTNEYGGGMISIYSSTPILADCVICGNTSSQIDGFWTDDGGNCVAFSCVDDNGDGTPDECGGSVGNILNVPSKAYPTIASAIAVAAYGDIVEIAAGTYQPAATLSTDWKPIKLRGATNEQGLPVTIIDGQNSIRVLECTAGESDQTIFENLVITGGFSARGAGLYCFNSSPSLINCTFENNSTDDSFCWDSETCGGGGMHNAYSSSPTLIDCTFRDNSADSNGGGMMNYDDSSPRLTNCTFIDNYAEYGGGMHNRSSSPALIDCSFIDNYARHGGGMYNIVEIPSLINCTFIGNISNRNGGGMCNVYTIRGTNSKIVDCTFMNNDARLGAGMFNDNQSNVTLENCTLTGNVARSNGGGMCNWNSIPTLINCTCSYNSITLDGSSGGIYNFAGGSSTLTNTIVCGNERGQIDGDWTDNGGNTVSDECPTDCPADFNGDGVVNGADLTFLFGFWGSSNPVADVNNDGIVDGADLTVVLDAWGRCP